MPILTLNRLRSLTGLASAGLVALLVVFTVTLSLLAEEAPTAPAPVNSAKADAAKGADTKKTAKAKKEPKPEKMLVTIGKETTVITEPLLPSGYPDYLAALNNEFKKGVTPDNNGAVVLVRVLGPVNLFRDLETNREAAEKRAANYYRQLGIEPLPEKGEYLQSWDEYFESIPTNKLPPLAEEDLASFAVEDGSAPEELEIRAYWCERLLDEAMERPWIVKDNPHVAAWLKAQAPALAKLNELSKRPKFYSPQVHEQPGGPLYEANDALVHGPIRKIPQLLKARTMLAIGEGRLDDAISDWETSYLISGYLADSPTVIHLLIGIACNGLTQESAYSIIFHPAVTQTQLQRMRSFRQRHICSYNAVKPFNIGERFFMLSSICNMARSGEIDVFTDESKKWVEPTEPSSLRLLGRRLLWNFDTVMKNGNAVYDRMVEMQKIEDDGKRIEAWDEFDEYVNRVSKEATPSEKHPFRYLARVVTREGRSTLLSQVLEVLFSPALSAVNKAVVRSKVQNDLVELGLALVLYQKEHGKFPAKLEQLVPKYVKEIPPDRLNSRPLGYRSTGDGVLLYTASHDGIDSGGYNDGNNDADDIAIFTPNMRPVKPKGAEGEKDAESPPLESK